MKFTYKNPDTSNPSGELVETYDTQDAGVQHVLNWIRDIIGGADFRVVASRAYYQPGIPGTIGPGGQDVSVHGVVMFKLPAGVPDNDYVADGYIMADLRQCVLNPEMAAAGCLVEANLQAREIAKYQPPRPPAPLEDWQAPGARIGPPANWAPAGHFCVRVGEAGAVGTRWTGASGRQYELVRLGGFAFFTTTTAWKGL